MLRKRFDQKCSESRIEVQSYVVFWNVEIHNVCLVLAATTSNFKFVRLQGLGQPSSPSFRAKDVGDVPRLLLVNMQYIASGSKG